MISSLDVCAKRTVKYPSLESKLKVLRARSNLGLTPNTEPLPELGLFGQLSPRLIRPAFFSARMLDPSGSQPHTHSPKLFVLTELGSVSMQSFLNQNNTEFNSMQYANSLIPSAWILRTSSRYSG